MRLWSAIAPTIAAAVLAAAPVAAAFTFSHDDYTLPGSASDSFAGVAVGDLDNQAGADMVVPQHNAGQSWVYLNKGDGTFASAASRTTCPGDFSRPLIGQFTGDAKRDLLLNCAGTTDFELLPGDGAGGFGSPTDYHLLAAYTGAIGNLDGRPDLIFPGGAMSPFHVCFAPIADLGSGPTCDPGDPIGFPAPPAVGNLFAAGANPPYDRDQVFGLADNHNMYVQGYNAQGPGAWSYSTRYTGPANAQDIAAGDVNGDGLGDVVVGNEGSLSVFLSKPPTGGIDPGAQATAGGASIEIPDHEVLKIADFDGDGRADVIAGGTDAAKSPMFVVMRGHGDGTFDNPERVGTGFPPESTAWWLAVADVGGDAKPDVVVVNGDERTVRVFVNTTPTSPPGGGPGGPGGPGGGTAGPPVVSKVSQTASKWVLGDARAHITRRRRLPVGTTYRLTLSEQARVRFTFKQKVRHRRLRRGTLRFTGHAGADKVHFEGRLSKKKRLKPGRYVVVITATDASRRTSAPRTLSFTIAKRR